ncbi:MAG: hypothetical protein NC548_54880 [Lachnospiraceae bacterium]|nr:hypothetical protein [Lachnospiraceae bacterium]
MSEKCFFCNTEVNFCDILVTGKRAVKCDGKNEKCSFFKTREKYFEDYNKAIEINRRKGNCENCKYVNARCDYLHSETIIKNK